MKLRSIAILALFVLAAPFLMAQWKAGQTIHVTIPFQFYVVGNNHPLPAGDYQLTHNAATKSFDMMDREGHGVMGIRVEHEPIKADITKTRLTFLEQNGKYTLHMVKVEGDEGVHNLLHDKDVADITIIEAQ